MTGLFRETHGGVDERPRPIPKSDFWLATTAVCLMFLVYAGVQSPVPGVNEPHYLGKAKHYWNPHWCAGDLFLESSDAHVVFFQTIGYLTRWLTLPQSAWIGRMLATLLLATGWTALTRCVVPGRWSPLWTAVIYLMLIRVSSLSGEWVVGGVESKVFAYGLVFWSLASAGREHWLRAALFMGLAISLHPVVGGWSLIAGGLAIAALVRFERSDNSQDSMSVHPVHGESTARWRTPLLACLMLVAASLPGLLPALRLLGGVSPSLEFRANFIQVFYRLKHHLDPMALKAGGYWWYAFMGLACWFGLRWLTSATRVQLPASASGPVELDCPDDTARNRSLVVQQRTSLLLKWFCVGAVLIAVAGFLMGFRTGAPEDMPLFELRMKLLKFYPFRLVDAVLPVAAALLLACSLRGWMMGTTGDTSQSTAVRRRWTSRLSALWREWITRGCTCGSESRLSARRSMIVWGGLLGTCGLLLWFPAPGKNASRMSPSQLTDWIDACHWLADLEQDEVLVFTPPESWAFKWYAEQAEYVAHKDCPQDAANLVEWNRRLRYLKQWAAAHFDDGYSSEELQALREETGITHIVARRLGPFVQSPIYVNGTYRIYAIESPGTVSEIPRGDE